MNSALETSYNLSLTSKERTELLRLLEKTFVETHAERRRTEAPKCQEEVAHEESLLRTLVEKVRSCGC